MEIDELNNVAWNTGKFPIKETFCFGLKKPNDLLFKKGNEVCQFFFKYGCSTTWEKIHADDKLIPCGLPWCSQSFSSTLDHDNHFLTTHRFICSECKKKLPSAHFLDIHLCEVHDSFFHIMSLRKPMYKCLLEGCAHNFLNSQERKDHCIKEHNFPSQFQYFGILPQVKHKNASGSKLLNKDQSNSNSDKMEVDKEQKSKNNGKALGSGSRRQRQNNSVFKTFSGDLKGSLPKV